MAKLNQSPIFRFGKDIGYQFNTDVTAGLNFTPRIIGITTSTPYTWEWQQFNWIESGDYSAQTPIQTNSGTSSANFIDLTIPLPLLNFTQGDKFVIIFKTTFSSQVTVGVTQAFTVAIEATNPSSDPLLPFPSFNVTSPLTFNPGTASLAWSSTLAGLNNVNNTSDLNKPVSTATQTALNLKVNKAGDTINGTFQNSTTKNTKLILTGDATGNDSQGQPVSNTTPRIDLTTSQVSLYASGDPDLGGYSELIRLKGTLGKSKPTIAWYDDTNKPKAWLVAHRLPQDMLIYANLASFPAVGTDNGVNSYLATDTGLVYLWNGSGYTLLTTSNYMYYYRAIHQHISLETADTTGYSLYTRLGIPYNLDVTPITTSNAHFAITSGTKSGKEFGAFILDKGNTYSYNDFTFYPKATAVGLPDQWADSASDNIFTRNTLGITLQRLNTGNASNIVGETAMAIGATTGINYIQFLKKLVVGNGSPAVGMIGINMIPAYALDIQSIDSTLTAGEHITTRYTMNGTNFMQFGYRADGSQVTSYLVRGTGSKNITIGTTGANEAVTISGTNGDVTLAGKFIAPQNKPQLARTSASVLQYGIPNAQFLNVGTTSLAVNSIRYIPFYVGHPITLSQIQFEVTAGPASNANVRIGLYNSDSFYQPTTLVADYGSQTVASGFTGLKNLTISQALTIGWYLIAVNCDVTLSVRSFTATTPIISSSMGATPFAQRFDVSSTFGAFAGTGVSWTTTNNSAGGLQYPLGLQWA
jgi:hypothetical protein